MNPSTCFSEILGGTAPGESREGFWGEHLLEMRLRSIPRARPCRDPSAGFAEVWNVPCRAVAPGDCHTSGFLLLGEDC